MSTTENPQSKISTHPPRPARWPRRDGRFRFTTEQFSQLDELGSFEDRHVELLGGEIYEMTVNPPHATITGLAADILRELFHPGYAIRQQSPIEIDRRTQPEPDIAVVPGRLRDYIRRHPTEIPLVVEVSDATLRKDRTLKAHLYAQAGLADYWIINLIDRQLEIHRNPQPHPSRKGRFHYSEITIIPANGHANPLARPGAIVSVADLLP